MVARDPSGAACAARGRAVFHAMGSKTMRRSPASLNLSQFVATLQSAPEKEARGKSTEENGHETATEASRPLERLTSAGAVYAEAEMLGAHRRVQQRGGHCAHPVDTHVTVLSLCH